MIFKNTVSVSVAAVIPDFPFKYCK